MRQKYGIHVAPPPPLQLIDVEERYKVRWKALDRVDRNCNQNIKGVSTFKNRVFLSFFLQLFLSLYKTHIWWEIETKIFSLFELRNV